MIKVIAVLSILLLNLATHSNAATIWCNPSNTGTETGASKPTGYSSLWGAIASMSAGDTIIVADGNWSGYSGMTIDSDGHLPVSGTGISNMSRIVAETDWGVQIANINDNGAGREYITIQGFVIKNQFPMLYGWENSKIIRCGFMGAKEPGNVSAFSLSSCRYVLVEECIAWGGGRYKFIDYQGNNNIFRRCVARHDWYISPDWRGQESNFRGYGCQNSVWQNCISIDSDREEFQTSCSEYGGTACEDADFWVGDQSGAGGNVINGCIVVKGMYQGFYFGGPDDGESTIRLINSVAIGPGLLGTEGLTGALTWGNVTATVSNTLLYGYNTDGQTCVYHNKVNGSLSCLSSILKNSGATNAGVFDYIGSYSVGSYYFGAHSVDSDPETNGLLYPIRIEANSTLATAGSGGGSCGPTITKMIGASGTLYGETGWNTLTENDLWPFPNESTVKTLMSSTVSGVSGEYGFCAAGTRLDGVNPITLTSYIWEYLGNEIPEDIYGSTQEYDPPTITGPADFSTTATLVEIEGTYTVDPDLPDQSAIITWTLGEDSGFCVAALGVFSCTVPVELGLNNIVLNIADSNSAVNTTTIIVTRQINIINTQLINTTCNGVNIH